jgi:hypothetical protein
MAVIVTMYMYHARGANRSVSSVWTRAIPLYIPTPIQASGNDT